MRKCSLYIFKEFSMRVNETAILSRGTLSKNATISDALLFFVERKADCVCICDESGHALGILTKEHVLTAYKAGTSVNSQVCTLADTQVCIVHEDTELSEASFGSSPRLVVVDGLGKAQGTVSLNDLLAHGMKQLLESVTLDSVSGSPAGQRESLIHEIARLRKKNRELQKIIDFSPDSICVADDKGKLLMVNNMFETLSTLKKADVVGRNVSDLEKEKIFTPSVIRLALNEKRKVSILQTMMDDPMNRVVVTAVPIFDDDGRILRVISSAKDYKEIKKVDEYIQASKERPSTQEQYTIAYTSRQMEDVMRQASQLAKVDSTVLILGESGVGKEVIAQYLHENSKRKNGRFVHINCGAIPESLLESELFGYETGAFTGAKRAGKPGLIETAHKGTVLLDEIGEMPPNLQVKLLQVLQDRTITRVGSTHPLDIDVRFISATNQDLLDLIKNRTFRLDLYYRLNVVPLYIPPLRERKDDIIVLVQYFLEKFHKKYQKNMTITKNVIDILRGYPWPGNIRELENLIERLVVLSNKQSISAEDLPRYMYQQRNASSESIQVNGIIPLRVAKEEVERQLTVKGYQACQNSYKLAKLLGISQSSAHLKIHRYVLGNVPEPDLEQ
jgi:PAS domain S-box-containing protein